MSDRPADPAGDGPTTGGPKPSIADVASWLRRAAEERDRTGDPGSREASTAGADGGTEAPTSTTTAADEPEAEDPTDRPPVPTDHGDGAPVEPVQERLDDQVVAEAAPAPEAPAAPRPTGPAVRPARDLWGRLLPSVVAAGTDDSAGQPQAGTSTSPGADEAQAASSGDAARTEDGQERLAATGPGDASGAGGDARSIEQTASSSDGTAADTIWVPPEPAADDLAAGRTSTADRPGSGVGSWAGGTQADRVAAGPSALPLADTPPKDSGGTPPSDAALGEAEAVDEGISEARGDQPLSPSVGLVPEDPVRDGGGDDPGEPVDLGGPGFVGLKQTAGAEDVTEATPGDQGQGRQEAGDGLDDDHPALDLVPTDRATADRGTEAVPPVDVVASPDDQDQSRQGPGIDDEPPTHLVPSDEGRGHAAPGSPEPVDVTGPATASVWSRDGTLDDQAQDRAIGSAPGGPAPRPDQPADKGAAVPDDRPAPDPPSPPEPSAARHWSQAATCRRSASATPAGSSSRRRSTPSVG